MSQYLSRSQEEFRAYSNGLPQVFSVFDDHYDADLALFPESQAAITKVSLMVAALTKAADAADQAEAQLVVIAAPSVVDLTTNFLVTYRDLEEYKNYKRSRLTDTIERICLVHGIPVLNLYQAFSKGNPETLYFRGTNNHWNNAGQKLAAQELASYLTAVMEALPAYTPTRPGRR